MVALTEVWMEERDGLDLRLRAEAVKLRKTIEKQSKKKKPPKRLERNRKRLGNRKLFFDSCFL